MALVLSFSLNDKEVINLVIKEMLSERENFSNKYLTVFLKTKDNKQYKNYLHNIKETKLCLSAWRKKNVYHK